MASHVGQEGWVVHIYPNSKRIKYDEDIVLGLNDNIFKYVTLNKKTF